MRLYPEEHDELVQAMYMTLRIQRARRLSKLLSIWIVCVIIVLYCGGFSVRAWLYPELSFGGVSMTLLFITIAICVIGQAFLYLQWRRNPPMTALQAWLAEIEELDAGHHERALLLQLSTAVREDKLQHTVRDVAKEAMRSLKLSRLRFVNDVYTLSMP